MTDSILITSFDVWKPHQRSNASDDLLTELISRDLLPNRVHLLRKLPVDFQLAPEMVIAAIERLQPDVIVCCGMAERRSRLSIESNGRSETDTIHTPVPVRQLIPGLAVTRVSHSAGRFVCNHLYYSVLKHLTDSQLSSSCIFIHVPKLNPDNIGAIASDFSSITTKLLAEPHAYCNTQTIVPITR